MSYATSQRSEAALNEVAVMNDIEARRAMRIGKSNFSQHGILKEGRGVGSGLFRAGSIMRAWQRQQNAQGSNSEEVIRSSSNAQLPNVEIDER